MDHRRLKEPTASSRNNVSTTWRPLRSCVRLRGVLQRPSSNILKFCYECGTKLT